ncbi:pirin family protein (plasmid) [Pseudoalteromonas xiamenensis]|uniref:pirin family protein n=1 Tax=Pseudoalteromonas xiamenensis TaxID=882626 RepID=UPI0027E41717|nr:pirin family protein [Pseudoalteromonas xiamenensis]WMN61587.1 pirin family protein [Pseudoalteromonas xiamenensis]
MKYIRRSQDRGTVDLGWLSSKHSFSFGHYYDSNHMGIEVLRVINDDYVEAGQGFEPHRHRDMEIVSYVLEGGLAHKDNQGNEQVIQAGEVQRMSAGTGIMHSEYNVSNTDSTRFLQIWIRPKENGIVPSYQQKAIKQSGPLTLLVSPEGEENSLTINQDADIYRLMLDKNQSQPLAIKRHSGYIHIVSGTVEIDGTVLSAGDGMALLREAFTHLEAKSIHGSVEALWFDLPKL